ALMLCPVLTGYPGHRESDHADRCKVPGDFKIFEEMDSAIFIFRELGTDARTASVTRTQSEKPKT
ncbi:MAG: hypothetical protein J5U19_11585, partial [Candidatus Methanoperedens sp.]|nr:hypothetical protein [Candidatus Methanoperedens sp.]